MERPSNTTLALLGGIVALVLLLVVYSWTRDADQDKLGDNANFSVENPDLTKACAGQSVYDQVKGALFEQALQARAGQATSDFAKIAAMASIRMENAVAEGEDQTPGLIDCSGSMTIALPPGVTTGAGREQLASDVYYTVDPQSRKVVQLRNADSIVAELAGLTVPPPQPLAPPVAPDQTGPAPAPADPLAPLPPPGQPDNQQQPDEPR